MRGFTLIEVIVTMFILGILAAILVVQLYDNDPEEELDRNARAVVNVLQLARSYATSGYNSTSGIYGYGVYFYNNSHYLIYADQNNSNDYDSDDELIEDYYLDKNDFFKTVDDIFFSLTEAVVYSGGLALGSNNKNIIVKSTKTTEEKNIYIQGLTAAISYE